MIESEVFVLGAGPAGACAAMNLAPLHPTVVADRRVRAGGRLVESLPAAAGSLLADMGVLDEFLDQGHERWQLKRSIWEHPEPVEVDLLGDPDGLGWHLDRARFGEWLRSVAVLRGATLLAPAEVRSLRGGPDGGWLIELSTPAGQVEVAAGVIVDSSGRNAALASRLGATRQRSDRLVCSWIKGNDRREPRGAPFAATSYLEADPDGWWYTARLAGDKGRLLAFHTDANLPAARLARDPARLVAAARSDTVGLRDILGDSGFEPERSYGFSAAHSAVLRPCAGPGWIAAGDAALSFDPISSQGLLTALVTGLAAAEAAHRCLAGIPEAYQDYVRMVARLEERYRANLVDCYSAVTRWPASPFWARRQPLDGQRQIIKAPRARAETTGCET